MLARIKLSLGTPMRRSLPLFAVMGAGLLLNVYAAVKTGPAVGQRVPSFSLPDQNGRAQTLDTIAGPEGAMLVFYRSADW